MPFKAGAPAEQGIPSTDVGCPRNLNLHVSCRVHFFQVWVFWVFKRHFGCKMKYVLKKVSQLSFENFIKVQEREKPFGFAKPDTLSGAELRFQIIDSSMKSSSI